MKNKFTKKQNMSTFTRNEERAFSSHSEFGFQVDELGFKFVKEAHLVNQSQIVREKIIIFPLYENIFLTGIQRTVSPASTM
jgi:hypothetical protein